MQVGSRDIRSDRILENPHNSARREAGKGEMEMGSSMRGLTGPGMPNLSSVLCPPGCRSCSMDMESFMGL